MVSTFDKIYRKNRSLDDTYTEVSTVGKDGIPYSVMEGATEESSGIPGIVPKPNPEDRESFLRGDGTWATPQNTTYDIADDDAIGLMTPDDKRKLDGIEYGANNYELPEATSSKLGGILLSGDSNTILNGAGLWVTNTEHWTGNLVIKNIIEENVTINDPEENPEDGVNDEDPEDTVYSASNEEGDGSEDETEEEDEESSGEDGSEEETNDEENEEDGEKIVVLQFIENGEIRNSYRIVGGGETTVTAEVEPDDLEPTIVIETPLPDEMIGASEELEGSIGLVPAPQAGTQHRYLQADGTWSEIPLVNENDPGLMTSFDKVKLAGIENGANNYTLPEASAEELGGISLSSNGVDVLHGNGVWEPLPEATRTSNGLMSADDKNKLDGLSNYTLPDASTTTKGGIQLDGSDTKFLRGDGSWTTPSSTTYANASTSASGLMSAEDKIKLNTIESGANNYSLPAASTSAKGGVQLDGSTNKYLRGDGTWATPPDNNTTYANAATNAAGLMSAEDKVKLNGIAANANNYTLPDASTSDKGGIKLDGSTSKYLRGDGTWQTPTNTTYANASTSGSGLMSAEDKVKLNGIAANANNYTLPAASTAAKGGVQLDGSTNKYLRGDGTWATPPDNNTTYSQVSTTNDGIAPKVTNTDGFLKGNGTWAIPTNTTYANATPSTAGLMSAEDKEKLNGIAEGANNYTYTLPAATSSTLGGIKLDGVGSNKFLKGDGTWGTLSFDYGEATTSSAGLMSAADKTKLDGIGEGAGPDSYILPAASTAALGGIKLDTPSSNKFLRGDGEWATTPDTDTTYDVVTTISNGLVPKVTDTNGFLKGNGTWAIPTNTTYANATPSTAGLMSAEDKEKLNGIAEGANNYTYTLPEASVAALGGIRLTGGANVYLNGAGQWATPTGTTYAEVTTAANGLMRAADKTKLDSIDAGLDANTFIAQVDMPSNSEQKIGGLWFAIE